MTKQEFKEYLESLHDRWHSPGNMEYWDEFLAEGKLGTEKEFNKLYRGCTSINKDKDLLRKFYPTKLDKVLK